MIISGLKFLGLTDQALSLGTTGLKEKFQRLLDPSLRTALFLSLGSVAGSLFSFLVPVYLSRALSVEQYGTYKQIFLLQGTLLAFVHFGLDNGLFYFIKSRRLSAGHFSLNAIFFELAVGTGICLLGILFAEPLARLLHNEALALLLPSVFLFFVAAAASQHFEHLLVVKKQYSRSVYVLLLTEAAKGLAIVGGYYFTRSFATVFHLLSIVYLVRLLSLIIMDLKEVGFTKLSPSRQWAAFKSQFNYSAPLGLGQWFSFVSKLDRYIVSASIPLREFTFYSVGCFDVPFAHTFGNYLTDLMSLELADSKVSLQTKQAVWLRTKKQLFAVHSVLCFFLVLLAEPLIVLFFSESYRESAKYFKVYILSFLLLSLETDLVYRAFAKTSMLMRLQILYMVLLVVGVGFGIHWAGAWGALVGKVLADFISLLVRLYFVKDLLGLRFCDVLPWMWVLPVLIILPLLAF